MSEKKETIVVGIGDYPDSYYQTPEEVKELLYEIQFQNMRLRDKELENDEHLRSMATGLVQAKLGWTRRCILLEVSKKDAEAFYEAERQALKSGEEDV